MTRLVFVLGTSHRVQGSPGYPDSVNDPDYVAWLNRIISDEAIDFVFEEASECGTTTAEQWASTKLGPNHYRDVDPHPNNRHKFDILTAGGKPFPINIGDEERLDEQVQRENLWITRILETQFKSALIICGCLHTLSLGIRLRSAGFRVKYDKYIPHDKLCGHPKGSKRRRRPMKKRIRRT